jgi:hypothetical protein
VAKQCRDLAGELLVWQEELKRAASAAIDAQLGQGPEVPLPHHISFLVRDSCMLNLLFGHTSLAQRGSLLCSIKASAHAHKPCEVPNCPMAAFEPLAGTSAANVCYGNRFVWTGEGEDEGALQIVAPHHKGSGLAVLLVSDPTERSLLGTYELLCRPTISGCDEEAQQMFFDNRGRPFNNVTLNEWWRSLLE